MNLAVRSSPQPAARQGDGRLATVLEVYMSDILSQAEDLRQKVIALLLAERQAIEEKLAQVGYDGSVQPSKKSKTCSICGSAEHNARTCDQRKAEEAA
jgi:hypothetical protein